MREEAGQHQKIADLEVEEDSRVAFRQNGDDAVAHNQHELNQLHDGDQRFDGVQEASRVLEGAQEVIHVHDDMDERVDAGVVHRHQL